MYDNIWLADGVMRKIIFIFFELIKAVIVYRITASPTLNPHKMSVIWHPTVMFLVVCLRPSLSQLPLGHRKREVSLVSMCIWTDSFYINAGFYFHFCPVPRHIQGYNHIIIHGFSMATVINIVFSASLPNSLHELIVNSQLMTIKNI